VVRRLRQLLRGRPGAQHPQAGVELHGVGADDLAAGRGGEAEGEGGLALAVGPAISQMRGSMQLVLTTVIPRVTAHDDVDFALELLAGAGVRVGQTEVLADDGDVVAQDTFMEADDVAVVRALANGMMAGRPADYCIQPPRGAANACSSPTWTRRSSTSNASTSWPTSPV